MLEEPTEDVLDTVDLPDIHKALLTLRRSTGFDFGVTYSVHDRIVHIATYLVVRRDHYNCPFIYESLMDAAADPAGSAFGALSLWKDYEYRAQLQPTEILCRSALRVCAVHPDYAFRLAIEDTMKQHWFDMKLADHQTVVLAMLREKQYELAYTRFLDLVHVRADVDLWVYDVMITVFGYNEFLDEMVHIFRLRHDRMKNDAQFASLLHHVLDTSSAAFHYAGTSLAWDLGVTQGSMNLHDGILENVLNTASRGGDPVMGAAAYDMLASRAKLLPDHHHALMESFARAKDFPGLFQALHLIQDHQLTSDDLHRLALRLCRNPELHTEAESGLYALAIESEISLPAVEIMLIAKARTLRAEDCSTLYQDSVKHWGLQPGRWTLRELIVCSETVEVSRQYAEDYKRLYPTDRKDEVGSGRSYNQLIEKCMEIREPDLAYRFAMQYARDLKRPGRPGSYGWFFSLFGQAVRDQDESIWDVVRLLMERVPRKASRAILGAMERAQDDIMAVEPQPDEDGLVTGRSFSGQLRLLVKHYRQELVDNSARPEEG